MIYDKHLSIQEAWYQFDIEIVLHESDVRSYGQKPTIVNIPAVCVWSCVCPPAYKAVSWLNFVSNVAPKSL